MKTTVRWWAPILILVAVVVALYESEPAAAAPAPLVADGGTAPSPGEGGVSLVKTVELAREAALDFSPQAYQREIETLTTLPPVPESVLVEHAATVEDRDALGRIAEECRRELEPAAQRVMAQILVAMDEDWDQEKYRVLPIDAPESPRRTGGLFVRHSTLKGSSRRIEYAFVSSEHPEVEAALRDLKTRREQAVRRQADYLQRTRPIR